MDLLKRVEQGYFQTLKPEIKWNWTFEEHWNNWIETLIELKVSYECISGIEGLTLNNSIEIKTALEKEISSEGFWVFIYTGHSGEFDLFNYKTEDGAAEIITELQCNPYVTSIFIVDLIDM